jgi:hypothetical protein
MQCPPPLSVTSLKEYEEYVRRFGKLVTDVYNTVTAYIEEEAPSLIFVIAPPGSGKSHLLYQLESEYGRQWPTVFTYLHSDPKSALDFASQLELKLGLAVSKWLYDVLGKPVECKDPVCILTAVQAVATALGRPVHVLMLLDEYPIRYLGEDPQLARETEVLLKKLAEMPGFIPHVVVTAHYQGDWSVLANRLGRGALEKYREVKWFGRISLAPGFEKEAEEFVRRLACGVQLDGLVARIGAEMLREGYTFRHVIFFVTGAVEGAKKRTADVQVEREIHDAVVDALKSGLKVGRYQGPSKPDIYTEDGLCIEIKVRAEAGGINPLQHAGCNTVYVTISPEPLRVKNEIHIKADVYQLVHALMRLRGSERGFGDSIYRGVLGMLAKAIVAEALKKIGVAPAEEGQPSLCEKLRKIFRDNPRPNRSDLVKSAEFKLIAKEIFAGRNEDCIKNMRADCVNAFSELTLKIYGKPAVRVRGSTVELGDLCKEGSHITK